MFQSRLNLILLFVLMQPSSLVMAQRSSGTHSAPSPELWKVLQDWSDGSSKIKFLKGDVVRNTYLMNFEQEKVARGKFWFGAPDKGRLDIEAVDISQKMLNERKDPKAKIKRKKNGEPFELVSDEPKRWLCDGMRIYNIDDKRRTAQVATLPPDKRGVNIMNSPLPFLFGMPPDRAVERYHLNLDADYRPKYSVVKITAQPRTTLDKWKVAEIFLDTKSWIPTAVKMVDLTGETQTVYSFRDPSFRPPIFQDPWNPKIKGYNLDLIDQGNGQPSNDVFPNVVGQTHSTATKSLVSAGIPKANIKIVNAGPAPRQEMTYRVRQQKPAANSPFNRKAIVELFVFDKPKAVGQ